MTKIGIFRHGLTIVICFYQKTNRIVKWESDETNIYNWVKKHCQFVL